MDRKPAGNKTGKYKTVKQKEAEKIQPFLFPGFIPAILLFEF
jgi:hypothetical protein